MSESLDHRFTMVTGKGGVGKSTVTAALARRSAEAGHRTLVCELNTRERVPELFGARPVGSTVGQIAPNLWSVNINPAVAMEEYALMKLRFRAIYKLVFDNALVSSIARFVPGMNELVMMGKAFNHEREQGRDGQPAWDRIIVDAPATGHGVTFFSLPRVIRDAVPAGNLHREADAMWSLLTDPARTAVHLVCLPEELPVQETLELHRRLGGELGLPLGTLFLNQCPPALFDEADRATVEKLSAPTPQTAALLEAAHVRIQERARTVRMTERLEGLGMPLIELPTVYGPNFGPEAIGQLTAAIEGRP